MNNKEQAIQLRKKGYSYNEINKTLGIPKSTLSSWLKTTSLSKVATNRLEKRVRMGLVNGLIKRNKEQTIISQERAKNNQIQSAGEIGKISERDLLILGIAIYWAEGYKRLKVVNGKERTHHPISLTNSDPKMINGFITFLIKTMKIDSRNIKISLRLFPGMDATKMISYWSKTTGVPSSQFNKPTYVVSKSSQGIRPFNRLPYGIAQVLVLNTNEFHRLLGWIEGVKNSLDILYKKR